ncbi:MAG TPA: hypothetical protein VK013_18770 [Myxococcaceae bacterium]|nr:hypothetical protein [Myxococcaceae bacterium]
MQRMRAWPWVACLMLLAAPAVWAQDAATAEAKVPLRVDVVSVSNDGDVVEPRRLSRMKATFAKQGLDFSSFRRLSSERVEVTAQAPTQLKLPNGKQVSLRLDRMEKGTARVKVAIPGLLDETLVTLGRKGVVYQAAGDHGGGKLVLVLRPSRR